MAAGSLLKPEQFSTPDDYTFRVDFVRPDALTLPDIAVVVPAIYNSALVKKNSTDNDPWGLEFTKTNTAGGGAFKVDKWTPGTEVIYVRNDNWRSGPLPMLKRVIWRNVPSAGNRRALVERGDVDISFDLPAKDFAELKAKGSVAVQSTPVSNGMWCIELNVTKPPFDNFNVRQAVAYAVPYQKIMDAVMFGEAKPLFGAQSNTPSDTTWPSPTSYRTDMAKARTLLAEGGMADGFETTISLDAGQGTLSEPIAVLMQESLAALNIRTTIEKIPGSKLARRDAEKVHAVHGQFLLGLARLSQVFFLLHLSRAKCRLQHDELQESRAG
jgi:peptide/nickel transport system substrate-binding protein